VVIRDGRLEFHPGAQLAQIPGMPPSLEDIGTFNWRTRIVFAPSLFVLCQSIDH